MGNMGLFLLCAGIPLLFGMWAQWKVKQKEAERKAARR